MKTLILTCLTALILGTLVGCSDDEQRHDSSYQSASMQTDSKDMQPRHHHYQNQ